MATLNVKKVPEQLYSRLKARARRQRRSIAQEVLQILDRDLSESSPLSILDLKGLGRRIWKGVEAADHVRRERKAWD